MTTQNFSQSELDKFSKMASQWWDLTGPCKPLHEINPIRLKFVTNMISLKNKKVLDVGCGGGIFAESLALEGANVSAIDLNPDLITVAKLHLHESKLKVNYQRCDAKSYAEKHQAAFDIVTCMELLEHVPDPKAFIAHCSQMVKPGGLVFFSTINRNLTAYLKAIIGAEYLLKMLPIGTHDYDKFIKPSELTAWAQENDLDLEKMQGFSYNPLSQHYFACEDVSTNYLICFKNEN